MRDAAEQLERLRRAVEGARDAVEVRDAHAAGFGT